MAVAVVAMIAAGFVAPVTRPVPARAAPAKAAYFYHYMPASHLDSLASRGFTRALIHWNTDSLGAQGRLELALFARRSGELGLELAPEFTLQAASRLVDRPPARRYSWGSGRREADIACPLDSVYWASALFARIEEFLEAEPSLVRVACDLEMYRGSRHHYDAGPCGCSFCVLEYSGGRANLSALDPRRLSGLEGWQEGRIEAFLTPMLAGLRARHPDLRLEVLDLDYDSFVHRALARAIAASGIPVTDDCERSYAGAGSLAGARLRLDALGLRDAELIGGLWLKRVAPADLDQAVRDILASADGVFVFTTFSLWLEPARLEGPYTLPAAPSEYWTALGEALR